MRAHSFEAWTVAFSHGESPDLLYSGGDDSSLYKHDTSQWSQDQSRANLASIDSGSGYIIHDCKSYGAGVTAILPVQHLDLDEPDCILTGSYDEHIRVISRGSNMRMTIQAEKRLDGEIWQLKPLPMPEPKLLSEADKEHFYVLASCMHAGARVLEIRRSPERVWSIGIIAKFDEHESMNYASDVQPFQGRLGIKDLTFVSTSFYDKRLCVWNVATC
ncbi:MAG: hypothetical protein LQ342_005222 [Letrouitia transgressa]|nr:MAG: hypothetical protein LQ342_005222 [Letrouitia transgressa]